LQKKKKGKKKKGWHGFFVLAKPNLQEDTHDLNLGGVHH
jgi:hypothetical protein